LAFLRDKEGAMLPRVRIASVGHDRAAQSTIAERSRQDDSGAGDIEGGSGSAADTSDSPNADDDKRAAA
ncbi:MAG: hypothetical protein AAF264_07910, partial [Pseudomonadota bacterium]